MKIHLGQNFAHVMTAQLSWHVQNFGSNGSGVSKLKLNVVLVNLGNELLKILVHQLADLELADLSW